mmetsp:Transcript_101922/g.263419  ORF Transcript_101922/g.263419 Transcript_101922/m.263419 type:complete len:141 (-) Transcript_101922:303-725(-)
MARSFAVVLIAFAAVATLAPAWVSGPAPRTNAPALRTSAAGRSAADHLAALRAQEAAPASWTNIFSAAAAFGLLFGVLGAPQESFADGQKEEAPVVESKVEVAKAQVAKLDAAKAGAADKDDRVAKQKAKMAAMAAKIPQ